MVITDTLSIQEVSTNFNIKQLAAPWHASGAPVTCLNGKIPLHEEWNVYQTRPQTSAEFNALPWHKATGFGVIHGLPTSPITIDIDHHDYRAVSAALEAGDLPANYGGVAQSGGGKWHIHVLCPGYAGGSHDMVGRYGGHVELRATGQTVMPGSIHPITKKRYRWVNGTPDALATVTPHQLAAMYRAIHTGERHRSQVDKPRRQRDTVKRRELTGVSADYRAYFIDFVQRALGLTEGKNGYSQKFSDPDPAHDDRDPSAQLNYQTGHIEVFVGPNTVHSHDRDDVMRWLGGMTFAEFAAAQRGSSDTPRPDDPAPVSIEQHDVYPTRLGCYPQIYHQRTVETHKLIDIQSQAPSGQVAFLWECLGEYLPDNVLFAEGDFQEAHTRYLADHGINEQQRRAAAWVYRQRGDLETARQLEKPVAISLHAIRAGLNQLIARGEVITWDIADFGDTVPEPPNSKKCNTVIWREVNNCVAKFAISTLRRKTRTKVLYQFLPAAQRLANFARHHNYAIREDAYRKFDAPDNVQPEYGNQTPEQIAAWNGYRAPVYDDSENTRRREQAQDWYETGAGWTHDAVDRILEGRCRAIDLPPQPMTNAAAFLDAIRVWVRDTVNGGEIDRAADLAKWTGRERSTEARARERTGGITVQNTRVVACEDVQGWQWEYGLADDLGNGKARIKYRGEKSLSLATDDEIDRFERLGDAKREARNLRQDIEPDRPARAAGFVSTPLPETVPANYTDAHKRRQYEYFPLPVDFPGYDPATGEVPSTIDELWRVGADWLITRTERITNVAQKETPAETEADPRVGCGGHSTGDHAGNIGDYRHAQRGEPLQTNRIRALYSVPDESDPKKSNDARHGVGLSADHRVPVSPGRSLGHSAIQPRPRIGRKDYQQAQQLVQQEGETMPASHHNEPAEPVISHDPAAVDHHDDQPVITPELVARERASQPSLDGSQPVSVRRRTDPAPQGAAPGLPAPDNRRCMCCGAVATVQKLGGNYCADHAALPLADRLALADEYDAGQHFAPVRSTAAAGLFADAAR